MTSAISSSWRILRQEFRRQFTGEPTVFTQAPGRVNLIGEHTDYNEGLVLPAAVDRYVRISARPNAARELHLHSLALGTSAVVPLDAVDGIADPPWTRYAQAVVQALIQRGLPVIGLDAIIGGDLAIGAGLSSSAAFELAIALALEHAAGQVVPARDNALLCWTAETEFAGVPCGIMDQFASALGRRGCVLFLDCRSRETHHIPLGDEHVLAICDTGVRRAVGTSAYRTRRQECAAAVAALRDRGHPLQSLRDLALSDLPLIERLPPPLNRRARHVIMENARVLETTRLLTGRTLDELQDVFAASHRSLRDDYEVSCPELDAVVEAALVAPGCVAARMTGAGFGGAAVALVRQDHHDEFVQTIAVEYRRRTGRPGEFFVTDAVDGARVLAPGELESAT